MSWKDVLRSATPSFLLNWNRKRKKSKRDSQLQNQKSTRNIITESDLLEDLRGMGIVEGDTLLVHSSLSKIGFLENGPKTLVDALLAAVGTSGNILMPTSPNNVFQLNYIRNTPFFDVKNTPSMTGSVTEYFRKLPESVRSVHPTEPVSAIGPQAIYFTEEHFSQLTPYNDKSPFYKVSASGGKLLYIGVTLAQAGTNLHTLEDAVDFKFPVYHPEIFKFKVIDNEGAEHLVNTKVHDPVWSKKRKCDDLIPMFESKGALRKVKLQQADCLLVDAQKFLDAMIQAYEENGVTMYTPEGS